MVVRPREDLGTALGLAVLAAVSWWEARFDQRAAARHRYAEAYLTWIMEELVAGESLSSVHEKWSKAFQGLGMRPVPVPWEPRSS
jgi:hypothetical protein